MPTGSLGLDIALGVGGLPRGRVVEIYGPESSGKTTLTLQVIAEIQRRGGTAAFVDAEHALDPAYAGKLGVNVAGSAGIAARHRRAGARDHRHAGALRRGRRRRHRLGRGADAARPRSRARWASCRSACRRGSCRQALRKLTGNIKRTNTIVIFINQIRMKIGVMFGNPETTTGGNALKFYASVRLDIRRIGAIKNGEEVGRQRDARQGGQEQGRAAVPRGRVRDPVRHRHLARGRDHRLGAAQGIIEKSGAWYTYNGERIGQGKDNTRLYLQQHPEIAAEIEEKIRAKLMPPKRVEEKTA